MKQFIKSLISSDINIANNKILSDLNKKDNNKTNNNWIFYIFTLLFPIKLYKS